MSLFKKATKRIAALALASFGVMSAVSSAGLNDWTNNFVDNDKMEAKIVYGADADMSSANSILSSLKSGIGSDEEKVKIYYKKEASSDEGSSFKITNNDKAKTLPLGKNIITEGITDGDFDSLDSVIKDDFTMKGEDDDDYDYETQIKFNTDILVKYDDKSNEDSGDNDPNEYVDFTSAPDDWFVQYSVIFDDTISVGNGDDDIGTANIEFFGRDFTFAPDTKDGDKLTLYTGSNILSLAYEESKTVNYLGKEYTITLLGGNANSDTSTALVDVDGHRESITEGKQVDVNGLDIFVKDVSINTIGEDSKEMIWVELFVGSDSIEFPTSSRTDNTSISNSQFDEFKIDGDDTEDYHQVRIQTVNSSSWDVTRIDFRLYPWEFDEDDDKKDVKDYNSFEDRKYLRSGETMADFFFPLMSYTFEGKEKSYTSRNEEITFDYDKDEFIISFISDDDEKEYDVTMFKSSTTTADGFIDADDFFSGSDGTNDIKDGDHLILTSQGGDSNVYKVKIESDTQLTLTDTEDDKNDKSFTEGVTVDGSLASFVNSNGNSESYYIGFDSIDKNAKTAKMFGSETIAGSTPVWSDVAAIDSSNNLPLRIVTDYETKITFNNLGALATGNNSDVSVIVTPKIDEDRNTDVSSSDAEVKLHFSYDTTNNALTLGSADPSFENTDDSDSKVLLNAFGSYYEHDSGSDEIVAYLSDEIYGFDFFMNLGKGSSSVMNVIVPKSQEANKKSSLESEGYEITKVDKVSGDDAVNVKGVVIESADNISVYKDVISVGGPAVNKVTAELLGLTFPSVGSASGLTAGKGKVEYISGKNSIVVYGWSAADTTRAANKLNAGSMTGNSVEV